MNHGAESQRWHDHAPTRQWREGLASVKRWREH